MPKLITPLREKTNSKAVFQLILLQQVLTRLEDGKLTKDYFNKFRFIFCRISRDTLCLSMTVMKLMLLEMCQIVKSYRAKKLKFTQAV